MRFERIVSIARRIFEIHVWWRKWITHAWNAPQPQHTSHSCNLLLSMHCMYVWICQTNTIENNDNWPSSIRWICEQCKNNTEKKATKIVNKSAFKTNDKASHSLLIVCVQNIWKIINADQKYRTLYRFLSIRFEIYTTHKQIVKQLLHTISLHLFIICWCS